MSESLDHFDRQILKKLQESATFTHKEIAAAIGLSVTATYERIKRLEKHEIIKKYVALVDREKIGLGQIVFCNISLKEQSHDKLKDFGEMILKLEEVTECYFVAGNYDFLLKIVIKDIKAYQEFVITKLSTLPNVANVQSSLIMSELKIETALRVS